MYIRDAFITISFSSMGNRSICKLETQKVGNWTWRISSRSSSGTQWVQDQPMLQELSVERERQRQRQKWRDIETSRDKQRENRLSPPAFTQFHLPKPQDYSRPFTPKPGTDMSQGPYFMLSQCPDSHGLRLHSVLHRSVMNLLCWEACFKIQSSYVNQNVSKF